MKSKILTSLLVFIWLCSLRNEVNGQTFELIKQYYECKNLTMIFNGQIYVPDTSVPNNYLYDSFYKNLGIGNMTFDAGMSLIRKIYNDTRNCTTKFCNCVNLEFIDRNIYSFFFRNDSNFAGVRSIFSDFYNEYKWNLITLNETLQNSVYSTGEEYPTIVEFLLANEINESRINTFKYQPFCSTFTQEVYDACTYLNYWKNGTFITNPTNLELENQMVCELMPISRGYCSAAYQRIQAIWIWAKRFPKLKYTGSSLIAYFDKLISRSRTYTSSYEYTYQTIYASSNYISSYGYYTFEFRQENATKMNFVCLNSSLLRIDCQVEFTSNRPNYLDSRFTWFNFTFYSSPILRYNIDTSSYPTTNGSIYKDTKGKNIFQVFLTTTYEITIFHFDSKSKIFTSNHYNLKIFSPKSFFKTATGYMVGEPINIATKSIVGKRKKRNSVNNEMSQINESCETKCDRNYEVMLEENFDQMIAVDTLKSCRDKC